MLHDISARRIARDLHMIPPGHSNVRAEDGSLLKEIVKKSRTATLNAIIIIIIAIILTWENTFHTHTQHTKKVPVCLRLFSPWTAVIVLLLKVVA